jgi:cellulose synthase/poly-beta-1,6-N-acetylglucosamine synthase-like glycosyltransferase
VLAILFFALLFLVAYPYFVYPFVIALLARLFPNPPGTRDWTPRVSILIPVYNEEAVIGRKIDNALALDYPPDRLEVLVGSDGSSDESVSIAEARAASDAARRIKVFAYQARRGKPSVLGDLFAASSGEILVLTDASALIDPPALRALVAAFASDEVGAVSGQMVPRHGAGLVATLDAYRKIDNFLRHNESRLHSSMGAAGACYAIRRELFVPPVPGTILDDFVIPMRTLLSGHRLLICDEAMVTEIEATTLSGEFRRKVRTLAGNYQAIAWLWPLLVPGKSRVWFQLWSHKLLRLLTPYFMLALVPLNLALAGRHPIFAALLAAQALIWVCAGIGYLLRHRPHPLPLFHYPYLFFVLQTASLLSAFQYFSGRVTMKWQR